MATSPVKPSEVKALIPQAGASICLKLLQVLLKLPVLLYTLVKWAINEDGTPTDELKAWLSLTTTPGTVGTPTGVSASDGTFEDKVHVVWNPVTGATSYEVWRGPDDDSANASLLHSTVNTFIDDQGGGFTADVKYWYFVKARTPSGVTGFSAGDEGFADSTGEGGEGSSGTDEGSGSSDWVVPDGVTNLVVEIWGGSGAGGGCFPPAFTNAAASIKGGGGGGSGEYLKVSSIPVTAGQVIHFYVGAAGAPGKDGGPGGDTRVVRGTDEVLCTAKGGGGGRQGEAYGNGGQGGAGGTGGSTTVGSITTQTAGNAGSAGTDGYRTSVYGPPPGGGAGGAGVSGGAAGGTGSGSWQQNGSSGGSGKWKKTWS